VKFSEIEAEQWDELKPYVDTCLLPITGLDGTETPSEATNYLEQLRDVMDLVEIPYRGRIVTYPAYHYVYGNEGSQQAIARCCANLKSQGYKYIILITSKSDIMFQINEADLWIAPTEDGNLPSDVEISRKIRELWHS